nr:hypothetical protein [Tanacetum cinerariifolium]
MEESQFNKFKEDKLRVLMALEIEELLQPQGETMQLVKQRLWNSRSSSCSIDNPSNKAVLKIWMPMTRSDDLSTDKAVLMVNLSSCDLDILSKLKHSNYNPDTSVKSHTPVRIEAPSELPKDNFRENQNAPRFNQLFEINELKSQSQEKDTVIRKLKDRIKSLSGKDSVENVKKDTDEIETITIKLEHSVAKLPFENENFRKEQEDLKSIYKDQFDLIRKTRVQSKEHCASLIAQINAKSVKNSDLNAQLQEKVFAIVALKNKLRKLKGKNVIDTAVSKLIATFAPGMFKLDIEPISHRLKNNRDAHEVYLKKTIENTDTLRGLVECARNQNPSEPILESGCMLMCCRVGYIY